MSDSGMTRRDFLARSAVLAGAAAFPKLVLGDDAPPRAKVVVVTAPSSINGAGNADAAVVRRMMEKGITALSGRNDVAEAWKTFVRAGDKVAFVDAGTKLFNVPETAVEALRGIKLASPADFTFAVCQRSTNNAAWVTAVKAGMAGFDMPETVVNRDIYSIPCHFHEKGFTTIVTTPTLKSHGLAGVAGVVKQYCTMGKVSPRAHHANGMQTAGSVLAEEFSTQRHLVIVDALRFGKSDTVQYYQGSLIFGTDPVATDMVALEIYLRNCATGNNVPPDRHRSLADTQYKAGISDRARIDVVNLTL
jgi:hypothetical protein